MRLAPSPSARRPGILAGMDITEVILHQHAEQRRMFTMLEEWPRDDEDGLDALWKRLEILLEVHAEAEERFFYPELVKLGEGAGAAGGAASAVDPRTLADLTSSGIANQASAWACTSRRISSRFQSASSPRPRRRGATPRAW